MGTTSSKSNITLLQILNTEVPYSYVILAAAALLAVICYFWNKGKSKSKNRPPLPPGPWPLPIVGNLPFINSDVLHTQFQALTLKHGPLMKLHLGSKLAIVVSSPDMAREVLKTHDITFANHDLPEVGKINTYGGEDILRSPYGTHWRRLRKLCAMKLFTTPTMEASYSIRREETRQTVVYMSQMACDGSPVNLGEQIFLSIFNVVTRMMWGATIEGDERTSLGNELKALISDISDIEGIQNYSDLFPLLSRFDFQGLVKQMKVHVKKLDLFFERVMESHVKMVGKMSEEEEDFLQYLLRVKDDDKKAPLSMTHVKSLLMDMVLGGVDTSVNASEFAMAEVVRRPEVLNKIKKELDEVVGRDNIVEESHLPKFPYLQAVMKETLRLHPTLPFLVPHRNSETAVVAGYTVPKDSKIFVNVWAIQRDPKHWDEPNEFKPERFLDSSLDFNGGDFKYLPFGSGRRSCVAVNMAERLVLFNIASLLHSFDWEAPKGQKFEVEEKFGLVLKLKSPLVAIPVPRLSDPKLYTA
ncbi:PREDICTED: geraniol 8-hydroxylase-like isoform X3 [Camelina sativa]|uniref:Geraniol 8-hydroxylase-like isoform X1 n=1 Tax=Camelina sativa TaxID=90675 RepID=A0ABM1QH53_CAMSA|nr:PREDICTED: geraniol 8-hydroxylase-like isoform X1 [Camelina sativa]XP_019086089.1 PREDICTED: geraniol 8-hydroxylase-like isoform X2 [Camelina sativa]XP_019086091.1 PREDICTED: geraniol 8-hydroxylase-like isoform X3 [Camelina sativa]